MILIIWRQKTRSSGVQGHCQLHNKFETSLRYMRTCLKKEKEKNPSQNQKETNNQMVMSLIVNIYISYSNDTMKKNKGGYYPCS